MKHMTMDGLIDHLKSKARILHRDAVAGNDAACARIRNQCADVSLGDEIKRSHALKALAREQGFDSWKALGDYFAGGDDNSGAFFHPKRCRMFWNIWFADYSEAQKVRAQHGGYLLPYKNQFMVVDDDYIKSLSGSDDMAVWDSINRDWILGDVESAKAMIARKIVDLYQPK